MQMWRDLNNKLEQIDMQRAAVIMRNIWMGRNDYIFTNKFITTHLLIQRVKEEMEEYHVVNASSQQINTLQNRDNICWIPPENMILKAN